MWDSFTFEGLPAGGEAITATLSFPGTFTGSSFGIASLEEGSQTEFNDHSRLAESMGGVLQCDDSILVDLVELRSRGWFAQLLVLPNSWAR
jgi:hypothetical protein